MHLNRQVNLTLFSLSPTTVATNNKSRTTPIQAGSLPRVFRPACVRACVRA